MTAGESERFFVTGGTVPKGAPCYVERKADRELVDGLRQGLFCYVLTSRQMGKSSLMVRAAAKLREEGISCAVLDLTALGQNLTSEQWYDGLLNLVGRQLDLEDELEAFWLSHSRLGPLQRWMRAIGEVVLKQIPGKVVLFIDEIDAVRSLPFSTDEFFAAIRECYNRRVEEPELERLCFCLLGVAAPTELMLNATATPFNIGKRIDLPDFTPIEASVLEHGFGGGPIGRALLRSVLHWTNGHPYLTQRLCLEVVNRRAAEARHFLPGLRRSPAKSVWRACHHLFLSEGARQNEDNLMAVRERLLRSDPDVAGLLGLYLAVLKGRQVKDREADPLVNALKHSGIVSVRKDRLVPRNRIYRMVFDKSWVRRHVPGAEARRLLAAFRKGVTRTLIPVLALLFLAFAMSEMDRSRKGWQGVARDEVQKANRQKDLAEAARAEAVAERFRADMETRRAEANAEDAMRSATRAEAVAQRLEVAVREERASKDLAQDRLWTALVSEASALRLSGSPGRRFRALINLREASRVRKSDRLRDEAIACMAIADLKPHKVMKVRMPPGVGPEAAPFLDTKVSRFGVSDLRGAITVSALHDQRVLRHLPGRGALVSSARFSPDGDHLAVEYFPSREPATIAVWDLRSARRTFSVAGFLGFSVCFSRDGKRLAAVSEAGPVVVFDTSSGKVLLRVGSGTRNTGLAFSPTADQLAVSGPDEVLIYEVPSGNRKARFANLPAVRALDWSADGRHLAMGCGNGRVVAWDLATPPTSLEMVGHSSAVTQVTYSPDGRALASTSWDGTTAVWDNGTGRCLVTLENRHCTKPVFSADGRSLAVNVGDGALELWELSDASECRVLTAGALRDVLVHDLSFTRQGRSVAAALNQGFWVWDTATGQECDRHLSRRVFTALFGPSNALYMTGDGIPGAMIDAGRSDYTLLGDSKFWRSRLTPDGRTYAAIRPDCLVVFHLAADLRTVLATTRIYGQWMREQLAISPDGRWVAAQTPYSADRGVTVWDAHSGNPVARLPGGPSSVEFSSDGRNLVTGSNDGYRLWTSPGWTLAGRMPAGGINPEGANVAFSEDSSVAAYVWDRHTITLWDTRAHRILANLSHPYQNTVRAIRFSPDGTRLAVGSNVVFLWDLRLIRKHLKSMGLDWHGPPYFKPNASTDSRGARASVIAQGRMSK